MIWWRNIWFFYHTGDDDDDDDDDDVDSNDCVDLWSVLIFDEISSYSDNSFWIDCFISIQMRKEMKVKMNNFKCRTNRGWNRLSE